LSWWILASQDRLPNSPVNTVAQQEHRLSPFSWAIMTGGHQALLKSHMHHDTLGDRKSL
jgi:hypothetical protein